MDKSNLELFRQALSEALSNHFDEMAEACTEEIVCSEKHNFAMRAIVYGETNAKRIWSPKMKRIIAILVAAALLLTSCGIICRNEIREVFKELFASITFEGDESKVDTIDEVYELGYIPGGYYLKETIVRPLTVYYSFANDNGEIIKFEQRIIEETDFTIDSENGYSLIKEIQEYDVYFRNTGTYYNYLWNDGKYALILKSTKAMPNEEVELIIGGLK